MMITEIGHFTLITSFVLTLIQVFLSFTDKNNSSVILQTKLIRMQFFCLFLSFLSLTHAYITSDFSVINVVENSHTEKPLLYKISGVWGNHEGSMLLWVLILSLFGTAISYDNKFSAKIKCYALGFQGFISLLFLAFILFTSNPFIRIDYLHTAIPLPLNGKDLNPLLQDVGLAFHPPLLYLGYVGFSTIFSLTLAALITKNINKGWALNIRKWILISWTMLTAGIALGSWWAYYELGWGGFWFWDPVENASLMPWLAGTALLHTIHAVAKADVFKKWAVILAIMCFTLSLLGTFIVRSGIITSVHAFTSSPERGVFILSILFIVIALSVILYFLNNQQFSGQSRSVQLTSREGFLLLNNLLLCGVLSIVVIGTLYPTFLDVLTGKKISVGSPYFNISTMPFVLLVGLLIPFAVASSYKNGNLNVVLSHLKYIGIIALGAAIAISLILNHIPFMAAAMFAIGIWLIIMNSYFLVRQIKMNVIPQNLAHIALGIIMLGIGGTSLTKEKIISVKMNDSFNIADLKVSVENRETLKEHNYLAEKTYLKVVDKNNKEIILVPERRFYPTAKQTTTEADIRLFYWGDIYVATGEQQLDGGHTLRFWIHPFISCLWLGTSLLVLAGLLGLFTRRRTI